MCAFTDSTAGQAGDFFGEYAIIKHTHRSADVVALTPVELVEIERHDFLYLVRSTDIVERLHRLADSREMRTWQVLDGNRVLRSMTSNQKMQLQVCLHSPPVSGFPGLIACDVFSLFAVAGALVLNWLVGYPHARVTACGRRALACGRKSLSILNRGGAGLSECAC